jgi:uncharacterized protein YpuA (DUF1002 family)
MKDVSEWQLIKDAIIGFLRLLPEYVKHKNKDIQKVLQPLTEAYRNLTENLNNQPKYAEEILQELTSLHEIILGILSSQML